MQLRGHVVDRVNDEIRFGREQLLGVAWFVERLDRFDLSFRVNGANAFRQQERLGFSDRFGKSLQLTVYIRCADVIEVHQRETTNRGSRKSFGRVAADTTKSEYDNVGSQQPFDAIVAD